MKFGCSVSLCRLVMSLLVAGSYCVNGYHNGAPDFACSTMLPSHSGATAQSSPPPYQITTSTMTYTPGQNISGIVFEMTTPIRLCRYFGPTCHRNFPHLIGISIAGSVASHSDKIATIRVRH